jgi:tetratricopeptide (TPR) repeat protein
VLPLVLCCAALLSPQDANELWDQGRRLEAIERLDERVRAAPDDRELRLRLVRCEVAVHRYAAALDHMAPLGEGARRERGHALFMLARFEEALEHLDRNSAEQTLMVVDALEALARFEEADREVDRAAELLGASDADVLVLIARRHDRHDRTAEAVEAFRAALAADPIDRGALFGLGQALLRNGEREEALQVLERHRALVPVLDQLDDARRLVDMAPHHGPNHARVGDVERQLGRTDQAEAAYRRALRFAEGDQVVPIALRLARLLAEDRREVKVAVEVLREAAGRTDDARLWVRAGDYLMQQNDALGALQHYFEAEKLRPLDEQIRERIETAREKL